MPANIVSDSISDISVSIK